MAGYSIPGGGGDLDDLVRRAQAASAASEELRRKEEQRQATEERAEATETRQVTVRRGVADTTTDLTSALTRNTSALTSETTAIAANTAAWRQNAEARAAAEGRVLSSGGGGGRRPPAPPVAAAGGFAEDPNANARLEAAVRAQAAAEAQRAAAQRAYTTSLRPTSGATAEQQASLLAQREQATQGVRTARAETTAAQANVAAQNEIATARQTQLAELQRINAAQEAERQATERAAAAEARQAAALEAASTRLRTETLGTRGLSSGARDYLATGGYGGAEASRPRDYGLGGLGRPGALNPAYFGVSGGGGGAAVAAVERGTVQTVSEHATRLEDLARAQREATLAVNEASAAYAASGNVLQRHGALTTEFIQAFARGQVTLQEFSTQMVSTMGKFGGWAVAGGLVYGVFEAFKHLTAGATESQAAVQQLGRFIPGLGGPAGGGTGQVNAAQSTVRDISTQFNVPIKDVVDAMQVMARTFHNVSDAGDATRAVLAAVRLDQVPQAQAEQYLQGIAQSFGFAGQRGGGEQVVGVINSLNALQAQYGARVSQTLPGIARAAPSAFAGGLDPATLEAMVALGVRSGLTGNQVGTAISRSITNFAFSPASELTFRQYGIQPQLGNYGGLVRGIAGVIDRGQTPDGRPITRNDLTVLARALGGPQQSRALLPILAQEQQSPGALQRYIEQAQHPRAYQEDLNAVLGTVTERFRSIGIALEAFGSELAQIGAFRPVTAGLTAIDDLIHVLEALTSPLTHLLGLFNALPGPLQDAIAVFIAARGARALYNTTFGSNVQGFIGRLPGLGALDSQPRQAVRSTVSRLETTELPRAQRTEATVDARLVDARVRVREAIDRQAQFEAANADIAESANRESAEYLEYEAESARYAGERAAAERNASSIQQRAIDAGQQVARVQADIAVLKDSQYSTEQKITYLQERQLVALEETVNLQEAALAEARGVISGGGRGGAQAAVAAAGAGGGNRDPIAQAAGIAGAAAVVDAVATTAGQSAAVAQAVGDITNARAQVPIGARPPAAGPFYAPVSGPASLELEAQRRVLGLGSSAEAVAGRAAVSQAVQGSLAALTVGGLGRAGEVVGPLRQRLASGAALGGNAAFAGLIGSQVLGSIVPGGAGNYISTVGGTAATGLLLSQLLGGGRAGANLLGLGAGLVAGGYQQGGLFGGITSGIGGAIAARGGLSLAASLLPVDSIAPEIGLPLTALAAGGAYLFGRSGGGDSKQPSSAESQRTAAQLIAESQRSGAGLQQFGQDFSDQLQTSFQATGSAATKAQQNITGVVQRLTAEVQLFGADSAQGRAAAASLNQVTQAAVQQAGTDPTTALQILQSATQARSQQLQSQLQSGLAGAAPGQAHAVAGQVAGQYQTDFQAQYGDLQAQANASVEGARRIYTGLQRLESVDPALKARVAAARSVYEDAQKFAATAAQVTATARAANQAQQQATYAAALQQDQQSDQARAQLTQAQAGGSAVRQNQAAVAAARQAVARVQSYSGELSPHDYQNQLDQAQANLLQAQTRQVQQGLTELQSRGQLAEARVPAGDPIGLARQQLRDARTSYDYMRRNADAFDPSQINQALASVITARKAVADAIVQYRTQMNDLQTQIAEAREAGDSVAQAASGVAGARADVRVGGTPQQRQQEQLALLQAENQQHQATQQRTQALGSLQQALSSGDNVAAAQQAVRTAQAILANARGVDEQIAGQTALAQANTQYRQALVARLQARAQLTETQETGDPIAQAQTAIASAQRQLQLAHGTDETIAAEQALAQANLQYRQAIQQRYIEQGALAASQTTDPLRQLQAQIGAAARALSVAVGPEGRTQAQTQLNQLRNQYQSELISQREGTIQFQLDMQQIGAQQAINQLHDLLKVRGITLQQRQQILQQIHQLQNQGSSGQFDLSPSTGLNLPTAYDVNRAIRAGRGVPHIAGAHHVHHHDGTQVNVYVRNAGDVPAVADAIDRATGGSMKARLRSAGITGV